MPKYKITIHNEFIVEADHEDDARDGTIMYYDLDKHDIDIEEVEDDCS
mgnify:FL=1